MLDELRGKKEITLSNYSGVADTGRARPGPIDLHSMINLIILDLVIALLMKLFMGLCVPNLLKNSCTSLHL